MSYDRERPQQFRVWGGFESSSGMRFLAVMLSLVAGCAGTDVAEKPREVSPGPWEVSVTHVLYGYRFGIGPFQTSALGPLHEREARRAPKPEAESVHFVKDKISCAFEIEHFSGAKANVRAGIEDTGKIVQVGFIKTKSKDSVAGSVAMEGKVVGQFSVRKPDRPYWGKSSPEQRAGVEAGTITTSAGTISITQRFESPAPAKSVIGAVFQPEDEPVEEYRLAGQMVASRRGLRHSTVTIEPGLPLDVQFSIAAVMTIPITQQVRDEAAANAAQLSISTARLGH